MTVPLLTTSTSRRSGADPDLVELRRPAPPERCSAGRSFKIVDLFCGAGGLSAGAILAAADLDASAQIALAVETDPLARAAFAAWSGVTPSSESVARMFDPFDQLATHAETTASVDILMGGPPCQGNSNLNNRTRGSDPRNELYFSMASAARVLRPKVVLIENVPGVTRDHLGVMPRTKAELKALGYDVHERDVIGTDVGVPQRRKRHLVLAVDRKKVASSSRDLLSSIESQSQPRTVGWAIGDLLDRDQEEYGQPDRASQPTPDNSRRMDWLFDNGEHDLVATLRPACHRDNPERARSYKSVYGRLWWDRPAQTITTGYGSMGQGRYVHPLKRRTLTPREAARLQTIPDWMTDAICSQGGRAGWARMIGNAVPPFMARAILRPVFESLADQSDLAPAAG